MAGLLPASDRQQLEQLAFLARRERGGNGVQLQYFIVPSLEGEPIESLSIRAAEKWKLGSAAEDNGLLFVVARDDRRMRIEVGGGLEGGLTDAQSGRIIRDTLTPAFRAGRFGEGLYLGGVQALAAVGGLPEGLVQTPPRTARRTQPSGEACGPGMMALFALFILLGRIFGGPGGRRRSAWWAPILVGGMMGGGRGGGGRGGGGGSWGGGGGGFSGGGSSGSW